jgi:cation:H+ antiporter
MTLVWLVLGLALLMLGGEALIRGAVALARRLGVSPLMIGLTLVGFGTSTPELVTCLQAAVAGAPGLALGNVVGSNTANILLILGVAVVIAPVACDPAAFRRDGAVLAAVSIGAVAIAFTGTVGRLAGLGLLLALAGYTYWVYRTETLESPAGQLHAEEGQLHGQGPQGLPLQLFYALGGIALTILGARLLVDAAIELAGMLGVSDTIIGLTVVAVGTSLPELVTAVAAARRGHTTVAFGNVVGSNIYNLLGILGTTALVHPLPVPTELLIFDVWIMLAATAALILFAWTGLKMVRWEGFALLAGYAVYIGLLAGTTAGGAS